MATKSWGPPKPPILSAILGTLTIEEIFQDREKFATQVCVLLAFYRKILISM